MLAPNKIGKNPSPLWIYFKANKAYPYDINSFRYIPKNRKNQKSKIKT